MDVLYFAWVRERIGLPKERVETAAATVADLVQELRSREERYAAAFADLSVLRVAVDQELADFSSERRDQLIGDVEDVLDAIESRIATLDSRLRDNWDSADRLERAQAQTAVAALRRERSRVMEWHQRMQDSTGFTWESMKDGFNDAFDELAETWQNAEQNVRKAVEEE
jgi:molybdopterin synthase sulfur carrier subunit